MKGNYAIEFTEYLFYYITYMATILVVEDEKPLSSILGRALKKADYTVVFAYDGEEAIEKAKTMSPDLILLDLILPKVNGFKVLEQIKKDPDVSHIPVIVLSNLGDDKDIKDSLRLGAVDYYVKAQHPLLEIVEIVTKFLKTHRVQSKEE